MQPLNARDGRVRLVIASKFLQPVVRYRLSGPGRNLSKRQFGLGKKPACFREEVSHGSKIRECIPRLSRNTFPLSGAKLGDMATQRQKPKTTLAHNLQLLTALWKISGAELARRAHVDPKTVNNMINGRFDPQVEKVHQVAGVFGLSGWQLLVPNLPVEMLEKDGRLEELIRNYSSASEEGRRSINQIAEMAARYKKA